MQRQLGGGANEMRLSRERYILLLALTRAAADLIIVILFQSEGIVRAALLVLFWLMMPWLQIFEFWPKVRKTSTKSDKGSCTSVQSFCRFFGEVQPQTRSIWLRTRLGRLKDVA